MTETPTTDAAHGVTVDDRVLDGPHGALPVRMYTPSAPSGPGLLWAHGGGFIGGSLDVPEADWLSRELAARGILVVSVDYQLAPASREWAAEWGGEPRDGVRYPVASEEVSFAFTWAAASGLAETWAIGGGSAGANLATGATLRLMRVGGSVPALAVLAYPTLHAVQPPTGPALREALDATPEADRFGPVPVREMYENYLGGPIEDADIFAVPGLASASELTGFPPTIMINGDTDELRVSGEAFAETLAAAGVDIDISLEPGTWHGHLNEPDKPAASLTIDRFAARLLAPVTTP